MPNGSRAWRMRPENAEVVVFLETPDLIRGSSFLTGVAQYLERYGHLSDAQCEAVRRIMREQREQANNTDLAATPDEALNIPNGVFTIDDGSEHLTYRIHTVRNGRLAGKRIIKRQHLYGEFHGFAFLTRDGSVQVWRRFYADEAASERYIVWSKLLVSALAAFAVNPHMEHSASTFYFAGAPDVAGVGQLTTYEDATIVTSMNTQRYTINQARLCRRCNRSLTTPESIEAGIGPECAGRTTERTAAANAHEALNAVTGLTITDEGDDNDDNDDDDDVADTVQPGPPLRFDVDFGEEDDAPPVDRDAHLNQDQLIDLLPLVRHDRARFDRAWNRIAWHRRRTICEHCGRNDFRSAAGCGRHRVSCAFNNDRQERTMRRPTPRAQRTVAPRTPALSELGTRIDGEVWHQ